MTARGLQEMYLMAFLCLSSRELIVSSSTEHPNSAWVVEQTKEFIDQTASRELVLTTPEVLREHCPRPRSTGAVAEDGSVAMLADAAADEADDLSIRNENSPELAGLALFRLEDPYHAIALISDMSPFQPSELATEPRTGADTNFQGDRERRAGVLDQGLLLLRCEIGDAGLRFRNAIPFDGALQDRASAHFRGNGQFALNLCLCY